MVKNIIRALRLPFLTASILPFVFGSLVKRTDFNFLAFFLGLFAVVSTHLSANLINDHADSKMRADWQDKKFYKFFGGSKLIQENIFTEKFYLKAAIFFAILSWSCVISLFVILNTWLVVIFYLTIISFSWAYSERPFAFAYRRLGEIIIFTLFGPALVMGGYFIQTKIFPDPRSFILSLPFGFLTTAILFANEVPDFPEDRKANKLTWVSLTGQKNAFMLYLLLIMLAALSIGLSVYLGYLKPPALFSLIFILLGIKAARILRRHFADKKLLIESSKLTIGAQALVSLSLILAILI